MRALIASARIGQVAAREACEAFVSGWRQGNPEAEIDAAVMTGGAEDFLDAIEAAHGGVRDVVTVADASGVGHLPVVVLMASGTAYLPAQDILNDQSADGDALTLAREGTSHGVGQVVAAAVDAGAHRVVLGAGGARTLDLGLGMVSALAGEAPAPFEPERLADLHELVDAARARVSRVELVLLAAEPTTVRGLRGASAQLRGSVGDGEAQALEARVGPMIDALAEEADAVRPGLLDSSAWRTPGAGVGGGLGMAVQALGGRVVPGARFVGAEIGLPGRMERTDLAVVLTDRLDPIEVDTGVAGAVAFEAARLGVAVLALGREHHLDRRAGARYGISAIGRIDGSAAALTDAGRKHAAAWRW